MELFSNLGETTLASPYTAASGTMTVTSAASFPTTGVFRVRLGNAGRTIFRVDSVAGAVFTGVAEFNDANAAAADTVTIVISRGLLEAFLQAVATGEARAPYGSLGTLFDGPIHPLTALDQSGWTWDNQGTKTVVQAGGIVFLSGPATGAGTNFAMRYTAAPTAPYVITAALQLLAAGDDGVTSSPALMFGGIGWRQADGQIRLVLIAADGGVYISNYVDTSTFSVLIVGRLPGYSGGPVWLQIEDDDAGTHFIRYSLDGVNFSLLRSSISGEFTIASVGFALSTEGALAAFPIDGPFGVGGVSILSWLET